MTYIFPGGPHFRKPSPTDRQSQGYAQAGRTSRREPQDSRGAASFPSSQAGAYDQAPGAVLALVGKGQANPWRRQGTPAPRQYQERRGLPGAYPHHLQDSFRPHGQALDPGHEGEAPAAKAAKRATRQTVQRQRHKRMAAQAQRAAKATMTAAKKTAEAVVRAVAALVSGLVGLLGDGVLSGWEPCHYQRGRIDRLKRSA